MPLKLTIQSVAKMTGLSESTVRQYAWERKLGKRGGRTKVFTLAEAKKLGGLKSASAKRQKPKKSVSRRRRAASPKKAIPAKGATRSPKSEQAQSIKKRRSFWAFLVFCKRLET
jgi:hypothetical protein